MQECVTRLQFSADSRFLAGLGANNMFVIWDVQTGNPIHTRVSDAPLNMMAWGDIVADGNPKHPSYTIVTGNSAGVNINKLQFDISSMQYYLKSGVC